MVPRHKTGDSRKCRPRHRAGSLRNARDIAKGLEAVFFSCLTKSIKVKEFMDSLNATLKFAGEAASRATEPEQEP
jgi:hypothetical protein